MTVVAVVTQATGNYCLESLNPAFAHVWVRALILLTPRDDTLTRLKVMGIEATCVTIAMYCLIQFYVQLKNEISEHRPLIKVAAIKLVIFLSFWQNVNKPTLPVCGNRLLRNPRNSFSFRCLALLESSSRVNDLPLRTLESASRRSSYALRWLSLPCSISGLFHGKYTT